jgi:signal transduction histidine kinase
MSLPAPASRYLAAHLPTRTAPRRSSLPRLGVVPGYAALRRWQADHPRVTDTLVAAVVFAGVVSGPLAGDAHEHGHPIPPGDHTADALTIGLLAVAAGSLVFRRRSPLVVWAVALLAAVATIAHGGNPTAAVVPSFVALYTVGAYSPLRTTVPVTVVTAGLYALAPTLAEGRFSDRTLSLLAFSGVAAAVGIAVRSQRAAIEAAEARARQAEATREEEAERRVTDERLRIARELHDVVAHHISVINVQAGVARHLLDSQPEQARTALRFIREASHTVLSEMSTVLGLLRTGEDDTPTEPAPGLAQVPAVVRTMEQAGLRTTWRTTGESYPLPELAELAAYRVVQESLTNALKHGAGSADLLVDYRPDGVVVEVRNPVVEDGVPTTTGGHGLVGMRERVASLDGRFSAGPTDDGSYVVMVAIPRGVPA